MIQPVRYATQEDVLRAQRTARRQRAHPLRPSTAILFFDKTTGIPHTRQPSFRFPNRAQPPWQPHGRNGALAPYMGVGIWLAWAEKRFWYAAGNRLLSR